MSNVIPETPPDYDRTRIIERPDGFYWQDKITDEEYGPFETLLEAVQDMEYSAESDVVETESLQEAEEEIGVADWIDPETGEPAEESRPRTEDH
ncbi:MAG TPA: hypothetical protein PL143_15930 [Rhodocyclaceae bacterium]|nr:hypothetical protein [Rhodocyclaceae bacterium]